MDSEEYLSKIRAYQKSIPVHVVPIARAFGVAVFKNDDFPDNLSGLIRRVDDDKYAIHVNANHPITRQRFTMAHELAHFILHKDKIGDGITDDYLYRSGLGNNLEREANQLAAKILMPEHLVFHKDTTKSIKEQAGDFWVSETSMDIRLGTLL